MNSYIAVVSDDIRSIIEDTNLLHLVTALMRSPAARLVDR